MAIATGTAMVLAAGLGAGATIAGSRSQSSAARSASRIEDRYAQQALADAREEREYARRRADEDRTYERGRYGEERDYSRGQYANYLGRLSPYSNTGSAAVTNLGAATTRALPGSVPTMGGGAMVKIQAPNGQVRDVPAAHAAHYISLGGKQVG